MCMCWPYRSQIQGYAFLVVIYRKFKFFVVFSSMKFKPSLLLHDPLVHVYNISEMVILLNGILISLIPRENIFRYQWRLVPKNRDLQPTKNRLAEYSTAISSIEAILLRRLLDSIELFHHTLSSKQAQLFKKGFRPGRGFVVNIFVHNSVINIGVRFKRRTLFRAFIKCRKAFDSLDYFLQVYGSYIDLLEDPRFILYVLLLQYYSILREQTVVYSIYIMLI